MTGEPFLVDGRYRLDVELGAGAFGQVFRATQVVFGKDMRPVALKLFKGDAISPENVERMLNDALVIQGLLGNLNDWEIRQHFVTVFDLGITHEAEPRGFIAMELVPGGSLSRRLHDAGKFTAAGTFHYMRQIARAMAYMHEQGYVHSDLKPENVLVFRSRGHDVVKIGDLGLSGKYLGPFDAGPSGGTLSYLSLETLAGMPTTPTADVFAMGLMAYEMLTGENPYNRVGESLDRKSSRYQADLSKMHRVSRDSPLVLRQEDFPELAHASAEMAAFAPFVDVVNAMLAPVQDRLATAARVQEQLDRIAGESPPAKRDGSPAQKGAMEDPLDALARDCRLLIESRDWPGATQKAGEIIRLAPERHEGHLLKSRVQLAQADRTKERDAAARFLRSAITPLAKGLSACSSPNSRRLLRQEIANLYQRLGDNETAEQYRRLEN
jgi:serine/threonine protein kinase